jgi:hypothetical protein
VRSQWKPEPKLGLARRRGEAQLRIDDRYSFAAALSPSLIASCSLTYLPFLVVP